MWWNPSETLPGRVQLRRSRRGRGLSAGGRPALGRGADRRGVDVRVQPAHGAARHASRQLCPAGVTRAVNQSSAATLQASSTRKHLLQITNKKKKIAHPRWLGFFFLQR